MPFVPPSDPIDQITPVILTFNEEANIGRTLSRLTWARRIVVVDSGSTDGTRTILASYPQVQLHERAFDTHATQWNHGVDQVATPWALCLDADYQVTPELVNELRSTIRGDVEAIDALIIPFRYLVFGRPLRQSVYPAKVVMFRPSRCRYIDDGHTQLIRPSGRTLTLRSPIHHDDRKSLDRWLWAQERYHWLEAKKLIETSDRDLGFQDRIRKHTCIAPFLAFVVCYIWKQAALDGWRGLYYSMQRMYAELQIWLMLNEYRCRQSSFKLNRAIR
jgi:glycosyltransferase involved in cell wall biosynthesis